MDDLRALGFRHFGVGRIEEGVVCRWGTGRWRFRLKIIFFAITINLRLKLAAACSGSAASLTWLEVEVDIVERNLKYGQYLRFTTFFRYVGVHGLCAACVLQCVSLESRKLVLTFDSYCKR